VAEGVYREAWHGGEEGFGRKALGEEDTAVDSNGQVLVILSAVNLLPHLPDLLKPILV